MNIDTTRIAVRLREHPWVAEACGGSAGDDLPGALVALRDDGIAALCRHGRRHVTDALQAHLGERADFAWRLFDALPMCDSPAQVDLLLQSPLPRDVRPVAEYRQDGVCTLELRIPLDLVYFPGHFPRAPVLPGATQVAWALAFAAERLDTPTRCHALEALKFQQLLRPGDRVDLTLRYDGTRRKLYFAYQRGERMYSSGRLAWNTSR